MRATHGAVKRWLSCGGRQIILSLLFALTFLPLRADTSPPVTDPEQVARQLHQTLARPEFNDTEETGVTPRIEDLLSQWFKRLGAKMGQFKYASSMPAFESLLMSLLVALSIAVLIYVLYRLTRRRSWQWNDGPEVPSGAKAFRPPEFYDKEIAAAVHARDWHTAWLAAWRQFLSRLENRSLVESDRTRTNREYLSQLRGQPLPASALNLLTGMVDAYDCFIYGETVIGEVDWNRFYQQIEEAGLLLHLDGKGPVATGGGIAT